jgi:hypothetical protein
MREEGARRLAWGCWGVAIAGRLAALGGELDVRSAPGTGTTIAGSLNVEVTR